MAGLSLERVSIAYDGKPILREVSLEAPAGSVTAVIGPSGCGKTSLLKCMNGLIADERGARVEGRVLLGDVDCATLPREERLRRIGLVFQTPAPFPFSVLRNMTYAPRYYGTRDKRRLEELATERLRLVGLYDELGGDLSRSALKLSGGQQQRLCIARALTAEPEALLLDEPCSALDVNSSRVIEDLLLRLRESYAIVVVTHNIAQARRIADRVAFLHGGRLVECGPARELFESPREEQTRAFLAGAFG